MTRYRPETPIDADTLTATLTAADPYAVSPPSSQTLAEVSVGLAAAVVAADRGVAVRTRRSRQSRRTRLVTLALAGAVVVPTGAWAADRLLAQTGLFGAPGMTENDTSEFIDVCAADFPTYFATLPVPSDPAPEGLTWAQIERRIVTEKQAALTAQCPPRGSGVLEQRTGLTSQYYLRAEAVWTCRAVRAHQAGDTAAFGDNAARAATMIERLQALGVYGDDAWTPIRDGLRAGDYSVISRFYDATEATSEACQ